MTFQQKLLLLTLVATALACAVAVRTTPAAATARAGRSIPLYLAVVVMALIGVGFVSQTVLRHVIQVAPLVLAAAVAALRPAWASGVAAPLFAFWLLVMGAIWLFLLGLARIFTGTFSPAEIVLTIVIGGSCALGLLASLRQRAPAPLLAQLLTISSFAALQLGAMWLSVQPFAAQ